MLFRSLTKQHGFPGTYALKYDALMDSRYQALFQTYLDEQDEISAWWEITEPLCRRAGVPFRGKVSAEYDDRVDSAYCVGYRPEERKRLVDAYMADFFGIYGRYPQTIGSWVLDSVTLGYAAERYGILGGAICRDQMGTDGFTLWGGFPNGIYYPCRKNEFVPAQTLEEQIPAPMFRLLGPDPIYNFEQNVREGLQGGVHRGELFCLGQSGVLQLTLQLEDLPQTEGSQAAGRSGKDKREKTGRMKWFHGASSYLCVAGL